MGGRAWGGVGAWPGRPISRPDVCPPPPPPPCARSALPVPAAAALLAAEGFFALVVSPLRYRRLDRAGRHSGARGAGGAAPAPAPAAVAPASAAAGPAVPARAPPAPASAPASPLLSHSSSLALLAASPEGPSLTGALLARMASSRSSSSSS